MQSIETERENFRNLFRQTPEMVCILSGPDHRFEFVNEAHIRALGFDASGKTVREAQPESVEVHGILDDVYRTGETAELHEIPVTVGKRLRYFNLTYSARFDENKNVNGVMILGMEVTEQVETRAQLIESKKKYQILFDKSPLPKIIFDAETLQIVDVNETAIKTYGYSREEFLKKTKADLRPQDERAKLKESTVKQIETDVEVLSGLHHIKKDGTAMDVEISIIDLMLSGRRARLAAIVDVTEKNKAVREAEKANQLKSAFLANMSHEIRTPLGAMVGFAELLRDPNLTDEKRLNYLDILARNGESLSVIINDILDLSKVEAGHLTLEYADTYPAQIAEDVLTLLQVKAKDKNLELVFERDETAPEKIVADPTRLRQILLNLVGNAIKFTQFGSVIVRCFGKGDTLAFEIIDTGIGIPNNQTEKIFEMFVQADGSTTRRFGGTGLGLALSRRLARAMGGDIEITKTALGKGTTFLATVKDQPQLRSGNSPAAKKEKPILSPERPLEGVSVLVVDDSIDNQELIWTYLSRNGAAVDCAGNGSEGTRMALTGNYDVVLMDIQMPEIDGYTAIQKLRSAGYKKPIVALTAHAMNEIREKIMSVGANAHLPKPINANDLVATIAEFVH